jgi:hypothetical protein
MGTYDDNNSLLGTLLTWFLVAVLAIAVIKLSFWVLGVVIGVGTFLFFTVGPILLVGWLVIKMIRYFGRKDPFEPA